MLKRFIQFTEGDNGYLVFSISEPMDPSLSVCPKSTVNVKDSWEGTAWIDGDYTVPPEIEGKRRELHYNKELNTIDVKYVDITFSDLTTEQQLEWMKDDNNKLHNELDAIKAALNIK